MDFPPKHSLFPHSRQRACTSIANQFLGCLHNSSHQIYKCGKEGLPPSPPFPAQPWPGTQEAIGRQADPHSLFRSVSGCGPGVGNSVYASRYKDGLLLCKCNASCPRPRALCKWGPGPVSALLQSAALSVLQGSQLGCKSLTPHRAWAEQRYWEQYI